VTIVDLKDQPLIVPNIAGFASFTSFSRNSRGAARLVSGSKVSDLPTVMMPAACRDADVAAQRFGMSHSGWTRERYA
jgi:hypothetical protein